MVAPITTSPLGPSPNSRPAPSRIRKDGLHPRTSDPPGGPHMAQAAFVGIDVSKDHLDLAARPDGPAVRHANDDGGIAAVVALLVEDRSALIVVEATGALEAPLVAALVAAALPVAVVHP